MKFSLLPQTAALLVGGFVGGLCATSLVGAAAAPASASAAPASVVSGPAAQTTGSTAPLLPTVPAFATGDSNGSMIAVTGVDITGASVLYLIDTQAKQLACYQAVGGSSSTQGVKLVGARRIDLDLQLHGFNDRSEYDYDALEREFAGLDSGE